MSTVSGLASKADKEKGSKPKFSSLNINNIFKDKSSENTKQIEPVKHGLQTLGKIGAGRRVPPPANLPSLKSETINKTASSNVSTVNTSISNTSSGISQQGWAKKDQENTTTSIQDTSSSSVVEQQQSSNFLTETTNGQLTDSNNSSQSNVNVNNTSQSKTWNSVSEQQQQQQQISMVDTSPNKSTVNNSSKISSFFSQDFPTLDGGNNVSNVQKSNSEVYGSGPNLKPQTAGNWSGKQPPQTTQSQQQQNSINQQQLNNSQQGNQQQNSGNYVNGQLQQDDLDNQQRAYNNTAQQQQPLRNNNKSNGYNRQNYPQRYNNQNNGQYNQQYQRQYDNRNRQQNRIREDMPERAKVAILSEKELQGFDELLDDSKLEDWTKTKTQIDFNAKLNFSEDEDARSLNDDFDEKESDLRDDKPIGEEKSTMSSQTNEQQQQQQQQHSRYRRDYQNPRPHQSYNSNNSNKYERNNNYPPPSQQQQQPQQPVKNDNLLDEEKRMKLKSDLNEAKRRREDEDRKYNQPMKDKQVDQVQQSTNYNKPSNRNQDVEMMSNQHGNNNNYNNNNRQFQQSLPPRFQKLQQNTNQSSSYNRYDSNNSRNQQQSVDKDRKRTESQGSNNQDDNDGYQNKRVLNRQTNWRNNRELSKSQEKPRPPQINEEQVKKEVDNKLDKATSNESGLNKLTESESSKVDLDLKSSTNSNPLMSSSNSSNLIKKSDDDKTIKENIGGDCLSNDLVNSLTKDTSQLSINEKTAATKSLDKTATKEDNQTTTNKSTNDKPITKPLNASQESKHSDLKHDQQSSYKNQRGGYDNRSHYRQDDYRMYPRDYRNTRQPMDNRGNDKMNKNLNKKYDYVDDYRNRDYNPMSRSNNKYDLKKDDKYGKMNQQQQQHQLKEHAQKPIPSNNKGSYLDKPNRRLNEKEHQDSYKPSSSDKELSSSQNDKFEKKQPPQINPQRTSKDRKPDQVLDEPTASEFLSNKKQLKYPTKSTTQQHYDDLNDRNRHQKDKPQQQKVSNYERKNDHQPSSIRNQRKLSQDEVEKVMKGSQDEDVKKSKENVDKSKSKNEILNKPQKMNNNNTRSKQSNNPPPSRYYKDSYKDNYNKNFDYYHPMDEQYNRSKRFNSSSSSKFTSYKEDASIRNNKSHNLLTKNGLIINSSNFKSSSNNSAKNGSKTEKNDLKNDSKTESSKQIKLNLDKPTNQYSKQQQSVSSTNGNSTNTKQTILSGSSKSSSFDQQDSGIDLSDQLASNASSQRSSPSSNAGKTNNSSSVVSISCVSSSTKTTNSVNNLISTTTNKSAIKSEIISTKKLAVEELNNSSPKTVCNVIFENSKLKTTESALDKFANKLDTKLGIKDPKSEQLELSSSLHYSDKNKNEPADNKIDFSFNVNKPPTTNVSKVVGASRNVVGESQISPSTDDLNLKIASVKNVWESMPSMPSVLEINNEDSNQLDHKYDETKLRSPVRGSVDQTNAVHVLSTINSSNNSNNSSSFAFPGINMKPISNDDLKKSHQQLYQQHAANQMHHQSLSQHQQHPVLISTSPPNLMNHMNNPNLDSVRRVQNQYQLSNMQRISSPSNLIYNSQTQVAGQPGVPQQVPTHAQNAANVNIYQQFANHMKNMPQNAQLLPQFANHFATQHILQQRNQVIGQPPQNMQFVQQVAPQPLSGPNPMNTMNSAPPPQLTNAPPNSNIQSAPPQNMQFVQPGQVNLHQQNHLASHLIKQHVVQAAPNAFYQNQSVAPQQQSTIQPNMNTFYQNLPPPPPNAQKPTYGPPPPHQQMQQHHLGQQIGAQVAPQHVQAPGQQQFNYHLQPSQQFNLMNAQNSQLAANAQNYRNQKRFI